MIVHFSCSSPDMFLAQKIKIFKIYFFFSFIFLVNKLANTHSKAKKNWSPAKCFKPRWVRLQLQLQLQLLNPDLLQNQSPTKNQTQISPTKNQTQISSKTTKPRKPINPTTKPINKVNLNLQTRKFSWETNTKNPDQLNCVREKMNCWWISSQIPVGKTNQNPQYSQT